MVVNPLRAHGISLSEMRAMLDRVETALLESRTEEELVHDLMEAGYWANDVLQARVSYEEHIELLNLLQRVKYLQMLYLENVLNHRATHLSKELKGLLSDEAWRVFLRLDEVRGMELEYFQGSAFHPDFNMELITSEQALRSRISALKLRTY